MPNFRTYHDGVAIYSVDMMIAYSNTHKHRIDSIPLSEFEEQLNLPVWGDWSPQEVLAKPTLKKYKDDLQRIKEADLSYPILVSHTGAIMDGFHRVAKAVLQGKNTIHAHVFDRNLMKKFILNNDMNFVKVHQQTPVYEILELYAKRFC